MNAVVLCFEEIKTFMRMRCAVLVAASVGLLFGCTRESAAPPIQVGRDYPAVTPERLAGLTSSQRTGKHHFEFTWSFDATSFVIEGPAIPTDLIFNMSGSDMELTKIEGEWDIQGDIINLFVNSGVEDSEPARKCSMRIYSTGPVRIENSEAQYVFQYQHRTNT